jgi:hypothetical protein
MKVRIGFVSNSSSSSFVLAYKRDVQEPFEDRIRWLLESVNTRLHDRSILVDDAQSNVGIALFQFADNRVGYRSRQSLLDQLDIYDEDEDGSMSDLDLKALDLIEKGYTVLTGGLPAGGDGGSKLTNYICDHKKDYFIEDDDLILNIGDRDR